MAIEALTIAITATGALVVQRSLQAIGRAAIAAAHDVDLLSAAAAALAAGAVFKKFADELNSLQDMRNQLVTVTNSTEELTQAQDALLKVAKETRTPFEDTVVVFARVKRATAELGVSSAEAIRIVKTLNEALIIGGASGQERRSTIYQFTQALASGKLGGDELRSLLENAPVLTRAIADHMGVTIGQLRALGKAGKLTTEELVLALRDYANQADATFGKTTPTIQQALTVLRIQVDQALLSFDRMYDASGRLSRGLLAIGNSADTLIKLVVPGITGLSAAFIVARLAGTTLTAVFTGLIGVLVVNPFTAIILGLTALATLIYNFRNDIVLTQGSLVTLADVGLALWERIVGGASAFYETVRSYVIPIIKELKDEFGLLVTAIESFLSPITDWFANLDFSSFRNSLYTVAGVVDEIIDVHQGMAKAMHVIWQNITHDISDLFNEALNGVVERAQNLVNSIIGFDNKMRGYMGLGAHDLVDFKAPQVGVPASGGTVADAFNSELGKSITATTFASEVIARAQQIRDARPAQVAPANALGKETSDLNDISTPGKGNSKFIKQITKEADEEVAALKRAVNAYNAVLQQTDVVSAANAELSRNEAVLTEAVNMGVITNTRKAEILETLKFRLRDNLNPQQDLIDKTQDEIRFARMSNDNREIAIELLREENSLREKGVAFTRKDEYEADLIRLKEVQRQSQELEQTLTGIFNRLGDTIADFAKTGKLDFASFIDSAIADIIRLVVQETIVQPILKSFDITPSGGVGGSSGSGGVFGNILGSIFGSGGVGEANGGGDFIGTSGGGFFDSLFSSGVSGFAKGGSFDVGGSGGVDSQMVAFKATPGENVSVGQDKGGVSIAIFDQRKASGSSPVETQRSLDANGKEQFRIFIRDTVNENLGNGSHDTVMANSFGASRRGRSV